MNEVPHTGTYKTENYETFTSANGEILAFREVNNEIDSAMTKEEAITILCAIDVPEGNNAFIDKKAHQAIQMAIDALSIEHASDSSEISNDLEEAAEELFETMEILENENIFDTTFKKIFTAGAKWDREQILKSAKDGYVSGIIIHNDGDEEHYAVTYPNGERPHSITDKVKIIIL